MSEQMLEKQIVKVVPPLPITTVEDYAVSLFAETGRTVMVTRRGDAPSIPQREYDALRDIDLIIKVSDDQAMAELMKIKEMRERFQILESVPYTDIIIAHEVPTAEQLALKKRRVENAREGAQIFGNVIYWSVRATVTVAFYAVVITAAAVATAFKDTFCGKDPIVWARLEDGSWLEICRFYS
jgi:hypothetical protein